MKSINNNLQNLDGIIQGNEHYYYLRVYYEDTDAGQIVYHTNYLKYFERARTSLLNLLNIDQVELRKNHNINLVVRKADLIWHKPALFNDTILIKSCLKYAKNTSITINQQAYRFNHIRTFFPGRSLCKRCYVPTYFRIHMVLGNYNQ